ncbi:unnamed protein product [Aureobasidium pullulans]|nr:unnamed protein product [Aureobasidium pullulans]
MAGQTVLRLALICLLYSFGIVSANDGICQKLPYKDLLFLTDYAPAESFCSKYFPVPTVTVIIPAAGRRRLRRGLATTTAAPLTTSATTTPKTTSSSQSKDVVWASCIAQGGGFLGQLCSCIENTVTTTIKVYDIRGGTSSFSSSVSTTTGLTKYHDVQCYTKEFDDYFILEHFTKHDIDDEQSYQIEQDDRLNQDYQIEQDDRLNQDYQIEQDDRLNQDYQINNKEFHYAEFLIIKHNVFFEYFFCKHQYIKHVFYEHQETHVFIKQVFHEHDQTKHFRIYYQVFFEYHFLKQDHFEQVFFEYHFLKQDHFEQVFFEYHFLKQDHFEQVSFEYHSLKQDHRLEFIERNFLVNHNIIKHY